MSACNCDVWILILGRKICLTGVLRTCSICSFNAVAFFRKSNCTLSPWILKVGQWFKQLYERSTLLNQKLTWVTLTRYKICKKITVSCYNPLACRYLLFGARLAGDIDTLKFGPIAKGAHMAHVVPSLQKAGFCNSSKLPCLVSKGQKLPIPAVLRWVRLFRPRLAGNIDTSKFGLIAKGGTTLLLWSPLYKTRFLQIFETFLIL